MKKIILLIFAFCLLSCPAWATTYTAIAAGGNWSNPATWGGTGVQFPHAGDTAVINATMTGTVTIDVASACEVLDLTGNAGTLAFGNFLLTVGASNTGAVTLGGTITAGTGGITITGTTSLNSGGIVFPGVISVPGSKTCTLSGGNDWSNTGLVTTANNSATINKTTAEQLIIGTGGLNTIGSSTSLSGTANIVFNSACTFTCAATGFGSPLVFNAAGNVTMTGNVTSSKTVTFNAATNLIGGAYTLAANGGITLNSSTGTSPAITLKVSTASTINGNGYTLHNPLILNTLGTMSFPSSINVDTLSVTPIGGNLILSLATGTTLTVNTSLNLMSNVIYSLAMQSSTAAKAYFNYRGTLANLNVSNTAFTWIDASGSSVPIYNYFGGALSNTVNIFDKTWANFGGMANFY